MKKGIKSFLTEIITIIVGILVALFINDWNDNRKDKSYIDKMLVSIHKELYDSSEDITDVITGQRILVDTLDYYSKDSAVSLSDILVKCNRFNMPFIQISSWKAISNSRIELIDYQKMSALSNIEDSRSTLSVQAIKLMDFFYLNSGETSKEKKEMLRLSILSIVGNEVSIQHDIKKILEE